MRKRVFFVGGTAIIAAAGFLLLDCLIFTRARITYANVQRLEEGMELHEVEAILGKNYHVGPTQGDDTPYVWISQRGCAWVSFTQTGRLQFARFYSASDPATKDAIRIFGPPRSSFFDSICSWLGSLSDNS